MKHEQVLGIVLGRLNYGEADRIITILTDTQGKITVMARGVRKEKSKLAGGIELFSISHISFIPGKRDMGTLVSTRLKKHYKHIVTDLQRTQLAYQTLKTIDKVTEENCESEYFTLLEQTLAALDDQTIANDIIEAWFTMRLLKLLGHEPNLSTDSAGKKLKAGQVYNFDFEHMAFFARNGGPYADRHIKLLRLLQTHLPQRIADINGTEKLLTDLLGLVRPVLQQYT